MQQMLSYGGLPVADLKTAVEKQVEGQVALVNGDNLKQIIEKLLGIIQMILPIQNTGMQM
jgi:hypothetical protein